MTVVVTRKRPSVRYSGIATAVLLSLVGSLGAPASSLGMTQSSPTEVTEPSPASPISDQTPPTVPAGLAASAISSSQIDLNWSASTDAVGVQGYKLYRDGSYLASVGPIGSTSFSDTGLSPATAYTYRVSAIDAAGNESAQSSPSTTNTLGASGDVTPPSVPTGVTASAVAWNQVTVSWTAATDNVGVRRYAIARGGTPLSVVGGSTLSFTDRSTAAGTSYAYTVSAVDGAGNASAFSAAATVTTPTCPTCTTTTTFNPVADAYVSNAGGQSNKNFGTATTLRVASAGDVKSYLKFDTTSLPAGSISGATLRVYATVADPAGFGAHASTNTTWTETGIKYSNAPTYGAELATSGAVTASAYASVNVGSAVTTRGLLTLVMANTTTSNGTYQSREATNQPQLVVTTVATPADTTPPTVPAGLAASAISSSQIDLNWSASTDAVGVQGYKLYRDGSYLASVGPIGSTSFSDTGLSPATAYTYRVSTIDAAGNESAQSSPSTTNTLALDTTPPTVPSNVEASASRWNVVDLTWSAATDDVGVTSYTIFRDGTKLSIVSGSAFTFTDRSTAGDTTYAYTVSATDAVGNASAPSDAASVGTPAKPGAPVVALTSPAPLATIFLTEPLEATASAEAGVFEVDFLVDGQSVGADTTPPYSLDLDTTAMTDGDHEIAVHATSLDGQIDATDPIVVHVGNDLPSSAKLIADYQAGRVTDDEYALNGVYAYGSPQMMPARYVSLAAPTEGTTAVFDFLTNWDDLSSTTRDQIEQFLAQPLRGKLYAFSQAAPMGAPQPAATTTSVDPVPAWITDPCSEFRQYFVALVGYKCVHEAGRFSITYIVNGVDDAADMTVTLDHALLKGWPDYVENVAQGLNDAWDIYTGSSGHLFYPDSFPNDLIPVQLDETNGGQVLPNGILASPCAIAPCSPWETIQIGHNDAGRFYLAHHEPFHVLRYRYINRGILPAIAVNADPRWWMEASAEWAAGYVTQMNKPGNETRYFSDLSTFLGRPSEEIGHFDFDLPWEPAAPKRQYGAFVFAEFLAENMDHGVQHNGVIKEIWQSLGAHPLLPATAAIDDVAQGYDTSLADLLAKFGRANYFLDYDDGEFDGRPSDIAAWRLSLDHGTTAHDGFGPPRPARDPQSIDFGQTVSGSTPVDAGGAAYVELHPTVVGSGNFTIDVSGDLEGKTEIRVLSLTYPQADGSGNLAAAPTICDEQVVDTSSGSGTVSLSKPAACSNAVMIFANTAGYPRHSASIDWAVTLNTGTFDDFNRTEAAGWGTGGLGPWTLVDGSPTAFSVTPGYGQFDPELSQGTDGGDAVAALVDAIPPTVLDIRLKYSIENTTTESDFEQEPQFYIAAYDAGRVWYYHGVDVWVDKVGTPSGYFGISKFGALAGDVNFIDTGSDYYNWGDIWNLHMRVEGGRVSASLWPEGGVEPVDWMLHGGDPNYALPTLHGPMDTFYVFVPNVGQSVRIHYVELDAAAP